MFNWEAVGAIAESFGAVGVIATLVFLTVQIRQSKQSVDANTASIDQSREFAESQAYENRTQMILGYLLATRESDYIAEVTRLQNISDADVRHSLMLRWWCNYLDNLHFQYVRGHLDQDYYSNQYEAAVAMFAPQWRAASIREPRAGFKADVDRILDKID
jgi:hypothetical protein